ncbi:MAG: peptidylprolyl isomerase [Desulfobacterales bacterium]|nr:peptidylprolyl isomerase [Desulfobacterales bacterium]
MLLRSKREPSFRIKASLIGLIFFCVGLSMVIQPSVGAEVVDRIVAIVNNEVVTLLDVNEVFSLYEKQIKASNYPPEKERQMLFRVREDLINNMVDEKLTAQEAKRLNITIDEAEIDFTIERIKEQNLYTEEDFIKALAKDNITLELYRERLKGEILRSRLVNQEVRSKIVITDEDIRAYYESHLDEYARGDSYHLRNIFIPYPTYASMDDKENVSRIMVSILKELDKGASFEDMAKTYSKGPTAEQGGDLGVFEIKDLSPVLQDSIKNLKSGEYTDAINTEAGSQIIYVEKKISSDEDAINLVSKEIEDILYKQQVDEKFKTWLEELKSRSHIKIIK